MALKPDAERPVERGNSGEEEAAQCQERGLCAVLAAQDVRFKARDREGLLERLVPIAVVHAAEERTLLAERARCLRVRKFVRFRELQFDQWKRAKA